MTDSPAPLPSRSPPPDFSDEGYRSFLKQAAERDPWVREGLKGEEEFLLAPSGAESFLSEPQAPGGGPPPALASSHSLARPVGVLASPVLRNADRWSRSEISPDANVAQGTVCTRALSRQATSAVAYVGEAPEDDDPLLGFAPYLHPAPRSNSITPERQRRFVATLAATGIVSQAARSVGKSMEALYKLRARPGAEGFAAAWDEALERGMQRLEDCALERALKGTPTPIVSGGQVLGTWDKPDNNLLRFMLQHRRSGRYGVQNIVPGHPIYESIRAEVLAEVEAKASRGPRSLQEECDTIASINAKIDKMRVSHEVMEKHRERAEVDLALEDMGFLAGEIWPIPLTEPPKEGGEIERVWRLWQHPGFRRYALTSDR